MAPGKHLISFTLFNMERPIYLMLILLVLNGVTSLAQDQVEPIKPEKAAKNGVVVRLDIDTTSFPELALYNNLRFEIDPNGRKYDPRDTAETWNSVQIKKAVDEPGWYVLTFTNAQRKVAYRARPVFEAEDYLQALKTYQARAAKYHRNLEEKRSEQEKIYTRFILQVAALGGINNLDERASRYDSLTIATWSGLQQLHLINVDPTDSVKGIRPDDLYHYIPPEDNYILVPINAAYRDSAGRPLELTNVAIVFRGLETTGFLEGKHIQVAANGDIMILGIWERKLYVLPFEKYRELHIWKGTRSQTFTMQYVDTVREDLRYFDLRNLIERYQQQHR
jgi:hypothetical protein